MCYYIYEYKSMLLTDSHGMTKGISQENWYCCNTYCCRF